ncbi:hypothetical protein FHS39_003639 [Streptomyces olivoverticillatus]|uniref:Uncharacterized protein n=1 Tax=Streptomyces olivoverticillatus TaxID=66427 RepID=A0A7W7LRW5_9ACTN|nr:hypothetical protein [Streptomyces olivoverticillatus]MBB4894581.1 hypothetical protein [Streptomyces olivoverticillatus]
MLDSIRRIGSAARALFRSRTVRCDACARRFVPVAAGAAPYVPVVTAHGIDFVPRQPGRAEMAR